MHSFSRMVNKKFGLAVESFRSLHSWSVANTSDFWRSVADFTGIVWQVPPVNEEVYVPPLPGKMVGAQWFSGAKLNFAQNLIPDSSDFDIIVSYHEGVDRKLVRRSLSAAHLRSEVAACQRSLMAAGVTKGDRVCGALANTHEAIVAMLATTSLGAIWSSCSPDFGPQAIVDRFGQISPKVIFATRSYVYGGKKFDCAAKMQDCVERINAAHNNDTQMVWVDHLDEYRNFSTAGRNNESTWTDWVTENTVVGGADKLIFEPCDFGDPLYIMFSSGTTGVPKCIVHTVGGTLLQHKKELLLHCDLGRPGVGTHDAESRLLFFTTCGWMMWNWMASGLACGVGIVVYDGSPVAPDMHVLWDICRNEQVTVFGLSPKYVATCQGNHVDPVEHGALPALKWILSTGAPLLPEQFDWLESITGAGSKKIHVSSISGGTDILSCFMLGHPMESPRRGEIQGPGLGMDIDCWDESGNSLHGQRGELVCKTPFVSMPSGFWNDPGMVKYQQAYFSYFPSSQEVWRHGDFIEFTLAGGIIVHGRSDATLNPGGVRIGTAELYRVVERIDGVVDSVAVGIDRGRGEEILLLIKLIASLDGNGQQIELLEQIREKIRQQTRKELSARHVPAVILPVSDIPYTRSGKKMEMIVSQILRGEPVMNASSVANPDSMDGIAALRQQVFRKE